MKKFLILLFLLFFFLFFTKVNLQAQTCPCYFTNQYPGNEFVNFQVPCGTSTNHGHCGGGGWSLLCDDDQKLHLDCDSGGGSDVTCRNDPDCVAQQPTPTQPPQPTPTQSLNPTSTPIPISSPIPTVYEDRYTTCDLCGYCPKNCTDTTGEVVPTPGAWLKCVECLYPDLDPDPVSCNTLLVDQAVNLPPTPYPGHWYTMIGCISTNLGGFSESGAAGNVVQTLLNVIFSIAGGIAFLYVLYGSFLILTSQGDYEKLNQGKRVVYGAIAGLIFSIASVFLVNLIASGILKIPGFGNP